MRHRHSERGLPRRLPAILLALLLTAAARPAPAEEGMPCYGPWRSSAIGGGGYIQQVAIAASDPRRCYAYVDVGGAYRSDDGGRHWRMIHGGLPADRRAYEVRGLAVDPRDPDRLLLACGPGHGLFLSEDGGGAWRLVRAAAFHGNDQRRYAGAVLARDPRDPDRLLAGTADAGVLASRDGGRTWADGQDLGGDQVIDLRFDAAVPGRVFACTARPDAQGRLQTSAFWRSLDGGAAWHRLGAPGPSEIVGDPLHPGLLYGIVDFAEIRRSTDAGATWAPHGDGLPIDRAAPRDYAGRHYFTALAAGPDFLLAGNGQGEVYRLPAGGGRWSLVASERREQVYQGRPWFRRTGFGWAMGSLTVDPAAPERWFMTDWFAIHQTLDGGRTWSLSMDGVECTVVFALAQDPGDPARVHLGMADNGYLRSPDGGERFAYGPSGRMVVGMASVLAPAPGDPRRVYLLGWRHGEQVRRLQVSEDGGDSFAAAGDEGLPGGGGALQSLAVDPGDARRVYLAVSGPARSGAGGVYRSLDGARTWRWFGEGLPAAAPGFPAALWSKGGELAAGAEGGLVCIGRADGSLHWRAADAPAWRAADLPAGASLAWVCAEVPTPGRYFAASPEAGVLRSADGGRTWTRALARPARTLATHVAAPGRVLAGTADGVALSLDGGDTWRLLDRRLPERAFTGVAFAGERIFAATGGCGVFWMDLARAGEGG